MKARVIKIGNSQGLRIPKPILEQPGIIFPMLPLYCPCEEIRHGFQNN